MGRKQTAFTLIELLVVIAIIALLLAVIAPSLKKAKDSAMDVICRNQIRQYHVAVHGYSMDSKGSMPNCEDWLYLKFTPVERFPRNTGSLYNFECVWHNKRIEPDGLIMQYLSDQDVQLCPLFERFARRSGCNPQQPALHNPAIAVEPVFNYSQNVFLGPMRTITMRDNVVQLTKVKSPSRIVLYAEENSYLIPAGVRPGLPAGSRATVNDCLMYPIQNVANAKNDIASNGGKYKYTGQRCDSFGSFHKAEDSTGYLGYSNAVFVDGHVERVTPEDSIVLTWPH